MRIATRPAVLLALVLLPAAEAAAQAGSAAGPWTCRHANQTTSNNRFENWIYEFRLAIYPNGGFQAQGSYTAATAGFAVPFSAQGRWQQQGQAVLLQGQERRQDGTAQQFTLIFTTFGPGSMSNQHSSPYGHLLTYCGQGSSGGPRG